MQEAPAASEVPQLFVSLNGPVTPTDDIEAAAVPVLLIVTVCAALVDPTAWLAKDTEVGEADSVALPGLVPVPESATVSEALVALLATVRFAEAAPAAVGVKVTLAVHDPPAAIEVAAGVGLAER